MQLLRKKKKSIKPLISDKVINQPKITLVEKVKILSDEKPVTGTVNNFFTKLMESYRMPQYKLEISIKMSSGHDK